MISTAFVYERQWADMGSRTRIVKCADTKRVNDGCLRQSERTRVSSPRVGWILREEKGSGLTNGHFDPAHNLFKSLFQA